MNNFKLIASNIDTQPLLNLIEQQPKLWNMCDFRRRDNRPHAQVDDIIVRFDKIPQYTGGVDCVNWYAYTMLSPILPEILEMMRVTVKGRNIGRVIITRIAPNNSVRAHIDTDASVQTHKRYHICLYGSEGNTFSSGNETIEMRTGEFWWFENKIVHSCVNLGEESRIHLIVDIA
jgi:quercetin dioxygenase-like cupin family protein